MFRTDDTLNDQLFVRSVREFLPETSDVYLYIDLFDGLDLSAFEDDYRPDGEKAIHPGLMLRTIFYGLTHGVVSGHKLAAACEYDNRFRVLSGEQTPHRRTIDRFINRHDKRIEELFAQVVRLAQKMGLVALGRVAIDGSHFKANTSKHKAMSHEYMVRAIETIKSELAALRASLKDSNSREATSEAPLLTGEIARREKRLAKIEAAKRALEAEARLRGADEVLPKAQKSFADLEALPAQKGRNSFQYAYNMQTAVDEKAQIIVACELHDNVSDSGALLPVVDAAVQTCGQAPAEILADAGYKSAANAAGLEERGVTPTLAMGKGEDEGSAFLGGQLEFDTERAKYRCPKGKLLPTEIEERGGARVLIPKGHCIRCPRVGSCPLFGKQGCSISLPPEKSRAALARNAERLRSATGKESYKRRKAIVEAPFGNMKNKGMKLLVRGKGKVKTRFRMFATAHNIEKIIGAMRMGRAKATNA